MLDRHDAATLNDQPPQLCEQLAHVFQMQRGSRFVDDVVCCIGAATAALLARPSTSLSRYRISRISGSSIASIRTPQIVPVMLARAGLSAKGCGEELFDGGTRTPALTLDGGGISQLGSVAS